MRAETIAVGSELLTPFRTDTNSTEISRYLMDIGINVAYKTVVGDSEEDIARAVRTAVSRVQVVIITGGLGPTNDDLTREGVSKALKIQLIFREDILKHLKERYKQLGREMPENVAREAFVLEGAEVIYNKVGTAPGMWLEKPEQNLYLAILPGPPAEWKPMFEEVVLPKLSGRSKHNIVRRILKVTGLSEAETEEIISPIYAGSKNPWVSILPYPGEIEIHIWAKAKEKADAELMVEQMQEKFLKVLGENVYTTDERPLEQIVGELLREKGKTLAVAESCTGGLLANKITNIPGSSDYFLMGAVTYSNEAKIKVLGVSEKDIEEYGAVSEQVAAQMAEGVRRIAGSDFGIGITGIAGPGGATPKKPVGLVYTALSWEGGTEVIRNRFAGNRLQIKEQSCKKALDMLRRKLLK